jgi:hypothetical protein
MKKQFICPFLSYAADQFEWQIYIDQSNQIQDSVWDPVEELSIVLFVYLQMQGQAFKWAKR